MVKPEIMAALTGALRLAKDVEFWRETGGTERFADVALSDGRDVGVDESLIVVVDVAVMSF